MDNKATIAKTIVVDKQVATTLFVYLCNICKISLIDGGCFSRYADIMQIAKSCLQDYDQDYDQWIINTTIILDDDQGYLDDKIALIIKAISLASGKQVATINKKVINKKITGKSPIISTIQKAIVNN